MPASSGAPGVEPPELQSSSDGDSKADSDISTSVRTGAKTRPTRAKPATSAPILQRKRKERYGRFE
jgi:hypothetical protein